MNLESIWIRLYNLWLYCTAMTDQSVLFFFFFINRCENILKRCKIVRLYLLDLNLLLLFYPKQLEYENIITYWAEFVKLLISWNRKKKKKMLMLDISYAAAEYEKFRNFATNFTKSTGFDCLINWQIILLWFQKLIINIFLNVYKSFINVLWTKMIYFFSIITY